MKRNMGTFDRATRFLAGLAFLGIGIAGNLHPELVILGGIAMMTAAAGFCPAYAPFGFKTLDERRAAPLAKQAQLAKAA